MNINLNQTMQETMRLMRAGDLHAATLAIQRGLRGEDCMNTNKTTAGFGAGARCFDGQYRVISDSDSPDLHGPPPTHSPGDVPINEPGGEFRDHRFTCDAGSMRYKLFIPAGVGAGAPLIVMLHGCMQSPDDFARGTRMNLLAQEHGYVVAYPAQSKSNNAGRCWNWFRNRDQQRGQGEPAILAALTRYLVKGHGLDERRVYVAGLSAGGAMAAVLGSTYPDVYAAIGVHSGLPFGVAHDLPSAFAAMKQGAGKLTSGVPPGRVGAVRAIVFHGDRDTTVDPCNGAAVVEQCLGSAGAAGDAQTGAARTTVEHGVAPGGRRYTRTIFRDAAGGAVAEQWLVHDAGHAWFGGDASGSYTDSAGPDASGQMLRFFSACARAAIN